MKIEELRIGNLVREGRIIELRANSARVVYVRPDTNVEATALVRYEDLEVFPLTAAWLLKFGFDQLDMADLGVYYSIDIGDGESLNFQNGHIWIGQFKTSASHVHQLQNLYFALTGQELTINTLSEGK